MPRVACAELVEVWRTGLCFEAGSGKQEAGSGKQDAGNEQ